ADVLTHVAPFDRSDEVQVTIAETRSDGCLRACLEEMLPNAAVRCEIMARIKGLERDLVVWRTSDRIPSDESAEQTVHTILTRARSLAVIMLDPSATPNDVVPALAAIRQNRLLFWTKSAEAAWNDLVGLNDQ